MIRDFENYYAKTLLQSKLIVLEDDRRHLKEYFHQTNYSGPLVTKLNTVRLRMLAQREIAKKFATVKQEIASCKQQLAAYELSEVAYAGI